jgi:hypothetical protein
LIFFNLNFFLKKIKVLIDGVEWDNVNFVSINSVYSTKIAFNIALFPEIIQSTSFNEMEFN